MADTNYSKMPFSKAGVAMFRECLKAELKTAVHQTGRLFLMQCSRKMKRHGCKFPCMKTTRPIAITSVMDKVLDRIFMEKVKPIILQNTSIYNAGFKPEMSTEV